MTLQKKFRHRIADIGREHNAEKNAEYEAENDAENNAGHVTEMRKKNDAGVFRKQEGWEITLWQDIQ